MTTIVVYDACVLYPAALRDLLIRLSLAGLYQARWTDEILDEVFRNLCENRPDLNPEKLARTRKRMCDAVPECLVVDHLDLIESLDLPDPSDRHVLAAAIRAGAQGIVTDNLADFPDQHLHPHGIGALSADEFVLRVTRTAPLQAAHIVEQQAADLKNPPHSVGQILEKLAQQGLRRSATLLAQLLAV